MRAADIEREAFERAGEFLAAATHEARGLLDAELDVVGEFLAGFVEALGAAQHAPAHDEGFGLRARFREPAGDEQFVESELVLHWSASRRPASPNSWRAA